MITFVFHFQLSRESHNSVFLASSFYVLKASKYIYIYFLCIMTVGKQHKSDGSDESADLSPDLQLLQALLSFIAASARCSVSGL